MCECVCYYAYFYYVNKLYVHVCVLERAKHRFFALPNPLSCSVMNKMCLKQTPKRGNILILQQSRCTIPFLFMWSHDTGVDNQHSHHAINVGGQRKAEMDKSTIGQKPQRIKIKANKTPKRRNILILQQSRYTIPFLFMWSHDAGVDNQHSRHAITITDREKLKWTKAP